MSMGRLFGVWGAKAMHGSWLTTDGHERSAPLMTKGEEGPEIPGPEIFMSWSQQAGLRNPSIHRTHLVGGLEAMNHSVFRERGHPLWRQVDGQWQLYEAPLVTWSIFEDQRSLCVRCVALQRSGVVRFLLDMVTRWLHPSRTLNVLSAYGSEFSLSPEREHLYIWVELFVDLEELEDAQIVASQLPRFERELRLGLQSSAYASRLMEFQGMSRDEKVMAIHERITQLMEQRPEQFSADLMNETQFFLAATKEEFKAAHRARHLTRLILASYQFRRLAKLQGPHRARRMVLVKVLPTTIEGDSSSRSVFGVLVTIHPMQSQERFEEIHLMAAIRAIVPSAQSVPGSFMIRAGRPTGLYTVYIDIASENREGFSASELRALHQNLSVRVRQSIAELVHPMFMPRNEEEVMRHIVTLSQQLRYVSDVPQVVVSFERQTGAQLVFTVIVLRVQRAGDSSMETLFDEADGLLGEWTLERRRLVGLLRKRHPKEASILRTTLPSSPFLRQDHSVDLVKARLAVSQDLERMIGSFRDYNGGMLQQQSLVLEEVRSQLGDLTLMDHHLLESFFHGISPGERRALLRTDLIAGWFRAFQKMHASSEEMPDEPHMSYAESPEVCWGISMWPEGHAAEPLKSVKSLIAQDRDRVQVQFTLPGWRICGVLTMSDNAAFKQTLRGLFAKRLPSVLEH
jgi:hypothetical protein